MLRLLTKLDVAPELALWSYLDSFLSIKRPNSQIRFRQMLSKLCDYLGVAVNTEHAQKKLLALTPIDCLDFISKIKTEGYADATLLLTFRLLRSIYKRLVDAKLLTENPWDKIQDSMPRENQIVQVRPTKSISSKEVKKLLSAPHNLTKDGIRDRAILAALFGGGLRRSEVIQLRIEDLERTIDYVGYIKITQAKGGAHQQQAIPEWAHQRLIALKNQRLSEGGRSDSPLFINYSKRGEPGEAISTSGLASIFKYWCSKVLGKNLSCHCARATAITKLLQDNQPIEKVAEFSRHKNIETVLIYDKRLKGPSNSIAKNLKY